jgi:hypothetical protein
MPTWVAVLLVSVLAVCPMMVEAGTTGQQPPQQQRIITKENLKLGFFAYPLEIVHFRNAPPE